MPLEAKRELRINPIQNNQEMKKYIQIVLDPDLLRADFFINFLNTTLGKKINTLWASPISEEKEITIDYIDQLNIYAPPIEKQKAFLSINKKISSIQFPMF